MQVSEEQASAEAVRALVAAEEAEVRSSTATTQALKDEAQRELGAVLPALEAAMDALDALNKSDIIEIKSFQKPPALVQLTMEGVCVLLGVRIWSNNDVSIMTTILGGFDPKCPVLPGCT